MKAYLNDEITMAKVSDGFSKKSNDVLKGTIGAFRGWLIYIQRSSYHLDKILNPVSFYSRKDFYRLKYAKYC